MKEGFGPNLWRAFQRLIPLGLIILLVWISRFAFGPGQAQFDHWQPIINNAVGFAKIAPVWQLLWRELIIWFVPLLFFLGLCWSMSKAVNAIRSIILYAALVADGVGVAWGFVQVFHELPPDPSIFDFGFAGGMWLLIACLGGLGFWIINVLFHIVMPDMRRPSKVI